MTETNLPSLRAIRAAILAAPPRPVGFPLHSLRDAETLQHIRTALHLRQFLSDMRDDARRAQSTPLDPLSFSLFHLFETTGDRTSYERAYFDRRRRLLSLTLTTVIDNTQGYLTALSDLIWELCNEYTWSLPAHLLVGIDAVTAYRVPPEQVVDLFAAHTAHALAEVVSLLGKQLDPWLHYRVLNEIEHRIFQPMFCDARQFEWESAPMNWAAVCGGCVGMAALILENDRERLVGMIDRVIHTMSCFLEGFGEDGGCAEGIGYWVYGFGYYSYFADMLRVFTEGRLDLLQNDHVQRIAAFPQVVSLGQGKYINFSDASERVTIHPGLGSHLTSRLHQSVPDLKPPDFHSDHIYRWANVTRDLVWTEPALLEQPVTEGSFFLKDLGWVVDRRALNGLTTVFAAKGGHNDEPHNHNDLGHFILHLGGESVLADLGPGLYTRKYFGPERYDTIHTGSQGHSVPVINQHTQEAGLAHTAKIVVYETYTDGGKFVLDLTRAYAEPTLESFVRSFVWSVDSFQGSATLKLIDRFIFSARPATVEECFISITQPSAQGGVVGWESQRSLITMNFDVREFDAVVETIEIQTHYAEQITIYRLRLRPQQDITSRVAAFTFVCRSK